MFVKKAAVMMSRVEAWCTGLCAPPFDGAQDDNLFSLLITDDIFLPVKQHHIAHQWLIIVF